MVVLKDCLFIALVVLAALGTVALSATLVLSRRCVGALAGVWVSDRAARTHRRGAGR